MIVNYTDNQLYPLSPSDRICPVINAYNGDSISIKARCTVKDQPVNYANSSLTFVLLDQRFSLSELWRGTWRDGIENVDGHLGLVSVDIPARICSSLRRGSYIFSLKVSDKLGESVYTAFEGTLNIEYSPTSDIRDIPYQPSGTLP